jgi:hypothetical protein
MKRCRVAASCLRKYLERRSVRFTDAVLLFVNASRALLARYSSAWEGLSRDDRAIRVGST